MATMDIDENAPVITREEIFIDAPVSTVWGLHTDISSWSEWLPDIDSSTIEGPLEVGTVFHWETFGLSIESTIGINRVTEVPKFQRVCHGRRSFIRVLRNGVLGSSS